MEYPIEQLTALIAVVVSVSYAYGKAFGPQQEKINQAIIDALQVPSRFRPITNFVTGVIIATLFTAVASVWLNNWNLAPVGILAGFLSAANAATVHDESKTDSDTPSTVQTVLKGF